jgi:DNA-binding SARP family transcriptional activator
MSTQRATNPNKANEVCTLHLLGDLRVVFNGIPHLVPKGSMRLLVFSALHRGHLERKWAAGVLWPNGSDERAIGNLRSSLWRLRCAGIDVLETDKWSIGMTPTVSIDIDVMDEWAGRLSGERPLPNDLAIHPDCQAALDLLPGWCEDWVIMPRERLRHRVLHALEAVSRRLSAARRHTEAVEAAMLAVRAEPFRDTAQRVLIGAHLAEGNWIEAQRCCQTYVDVLRSELGIEAPSDLRDLLAHPWSFTTFPLDPRPPALRVSTPAHATNGIRPVRVTRAGRAI